jgi:hypothetical protein
VLTDWIVAAAAQQDFPVQSTSIPGVAQRTGATTYYIELVPVPRRELRRRPCWRSRPGSASRHRAGERVARSGPRHRQRLRHARPHADDRLDRALLPGGGEDGDGDGRYDSAA